MARNFVRASSQYLINSSAAVSATPLTMCCWFFSADITNIKILMAVGDTSANNQFYMFASTTERIVGGPTAAGTNNSATTTTTWSASTWNHAALVCDSSDLRSVYLNGAGKASNAVNNTPSGLDTTVIGAQWNTGSPSNYFDGNIAEAAIWSAALTDAEVATLALGVSALMVRPESLVAYWPLIGRYSPEIDIVGGYDMTLVNAPTFATHPRVFNVPNSMSPPAA